MGEIASYHNKDGLSPYLWALEVVHLLAFLSPPPFCLPWNGSGCHYFKKYKNKENSHSLDPEFVPMLVTSSIPGKFRVSDSVSCC